MRRHKKFPEKRKKAHIYQDVDNKYNKLAKYQPTTRKGDGGRGISLHDVFPDPKKYIRVP